MFNLKFYPVGLLIQVVPNIGSHMVMYAQDCGHEVVVLDDFSTSLVGSKRL